MPLNPTGSEIPRSLTQIGTTIDAALDLKVDSAAYQNAGGIDAGIWKEQLDLTGVNTGDQDLSSYATTSAVASAINAKPQFQTETQAFSTAVVAAGGQVSVRSLALLDAFVIRGKNAGWFSAIKDMWVPVGDYTASRVKFLGPGSLTFNNFVSADYSETNGYVLSSNSNKWINTAFVPNDNGLTTRNMTLAVATIMPPNVARTALAYLVGCNPPSGTAPPVPMYGSQDTTFIGLASVSAEVPCPNTADISIARYSASTWSAFGNGVLCTSSTAASIFAMDSAVTLFRTLRENNTLYHAIGGIGLYLIGTEISDALCQDLHDAIDELMIGLRNSFRKRKLYVFGDSIASGTGTTFQSRHLFRFGAIAANRLGCREVNVSQGSRSLNTTLTIYPSGVSSYSRMLDRTTDLAVIALGANDKRADPLKSTTGTSATITAITTNLNTILSNMIANGKRCVVVGPNYGTVADSGSATCQEAYSAAAASAARTNRCNFVDAYQLYADTVNPDATLLADSIHPNNTGNALLAEAVVRAFSGVLYRRVSLDFSSISAGASESLSITINGARDGMAVKVCPPPSLESGISIDRVLISADNTITLTVRNTTGSSVDPAAAYWTFSIETGY